MDRCPDDQASLRHVQPATAHEVWLLMSDLVLDHQRRRAVAEALGMSFNRARAIRRLARQPMTMGQVATALDVDPPNATGVVDDLEAHGLVRRRPHPTDRRTKVVEVTPEGEKAARRADEILAAPPPAIAALGHEDLDELRRILIAITSTT
jgi:DNA-binding MarR family transcriptional regulator